MLSLATLAALILAAQSEGETNAESTISVLRPEDKSLACEQLIPEYNQLLASIEGAAQARLAEEEAEENAKKRRIASAVRGAAGLALGTLFGLSVQPQPEQRTAGEPPPRKSLIERRFDRVNQLITEKKC